MASKSRCLIVCQSPIGVKNQLASAKGLVVTQPWMEAQIPVGKTRNDHAGSFQTSCTMYSLRYLSYIKLVSSLISTYSQSTNPYCNFCLIILLLVKKVNRFLGILMFKVLTGKWSVAVWYLHKITKFEIKWGSDLQWQWHLNMIED